MKISFIPIALLSLVNANAQININDTVWANGTANMYLEGATYSGATLQIKPIEIEGNVPFDTTYLFTNTPEHLDFSLPVSISTSDAITTTGYQEQFIQSFSDGSFKVNWTQPGQIDVYDIQGRQIVSLEIQGQNMFNISQYSSGVYIVRLTDMNNNVFAGKLVKTNNSVQTCTQKNITEQPVTKYGQKSISEIQVTSIGKYRFIWSGSNIITDSLDAYIEEGMPNSIDLNMQEVPPVVMDTLWATGNIVTQNNETGLFIGGVFLSLQSHYIQDVDTTINLQTTGGGGITYNIPIFVGESTSLPASADGEYYVKWQKEGFFTDSLLVTFSSGTNAPKQMFLTPLPPLPNYKQISGLVRDSAMLGVNNIFVAVKNTTTNVIDSTRTNANGEYTIPQLPVGWYKIAVNTDNLDYFSYEQTLDSLQITEPTSYADTIANDFNVLLIKRLLHSNLNDTTVAPTALQFKGRHLGFNIQDALYEQNFVWFDTTEFTTAEIDTMCGIITYANQLFSTNVTPVNYSFNMNTTFMQTYNPYTTSPDSVGTNIIRGPPQTIYVPYLMNDGENVNVAGNPIYLNVAYTSTIKEFFGRLMYASPVSGEPSYMNATSTEPTDIDCAVRLMIHHIGRLKYQHDAQDIRIRSLRDTINPNYFNTSSTTAQSVNYNSVE
ncbi:MAG: carboxypeptidase regulatory-like domain-containing protein [Bacteroidales bacterium]|nr:carboxypeptidase regulatory-like domain-containing protein [Bacteroidales bacterium]MCF8457463.1 carboxypeptidase regulatory-like domain-containing protein [Bacteroidales bacterium]